MIHSIELKQNLYLFIFIVPIIVISLVMRTFDFQFSGVFFPKYREKNSVKLIISMLKAVKNLFGI